MLDPQILIEDVDCPETRSQVKGLIEDLTQLCPSDATVKATIRKVQDHFMAQVSVASQTVYMQAMDQASALSECLDHVTTSILIQIVNWRSHRFAR